MRENTDQNNSGYGHFSRSKLFYFLEHFPRCIAIKQIISLTISRRSEKLDTLRKSYYTNLHYDSSTLVVVFSTQAWLQFAVSATHLTLKILDDVSLSLSYVFFQKCVFKKKGKGPLFCHF